MPYQTIHEAAADIKAGKTTPVDLLEECLAQVGLWEHKVHAWVLLDRDLAKQQAKAMTDDIKKGNLRGPLHGIPFGIKDIVDIADWPTAAGSKRWEHAIARQDATIVGWLRAAGALFMGKTVTTQFASFDPPVTRNPWSLTQTPGGSSSGSAAALATRMCLGAIGSQTGGSITRPASYCGVAGCKPSYGAVPLEGIVPLAHSMDHPGPMARCVRDLALILEVIRHPNVSLETKPERTPLGRLRGLFEEKADAATNRIMDESVARLKMRGAEVIDVSLPAEFSDVLQQHRVIMAVEAAQFHRPRFERHPDDYSPHIRALIEEGLATSADTYATALARQASLKKAMSDVFRRAPVLLTPATPGPAPAADSTGPPAFNSPWSFTGLPTVSFPSGQFSEGMPLAVQLIGDINKEATLFGAALWCEQALDAKPMTPPQGL